MQYPILYICDGPPDNDSCWSLRMWFFRLFALLWKFGLIFFSSSNKSGNMKTVTLGASGIGTGYVTGIMTKHSTEQECQTPCAQARIRPQGSSVAAIIAMATTDKQPQARQIAVVQAAQVVVVWAATRCVEPCQHNPCLPPATESCVPQGLGVPDYVADPAHL